MIWDSRFAWLTRLLHDNLNREKGEGVMKTVVAHPLDDDKDEEYWPLMSVKIIPMLKSAIGSYILHKFKI